MKKVRHSRIRCPSRPLAASLAALLAAGLLLGGCAGRSGNFNAALSETTAAPYDTVIAETAAAEIYEEQLMVPQEAATEAGSYDGSGSTENTGSAGVTSDTGALTETDGDPLPLKRKLIRTVSMEVETLEFDDLITAIQEDTDRLNGYIEQSDISGNSITSQGRPSSRYGSMTIRIPADQLNDFITQVESNGNVIYKSENVTDVTLQYSDVESRLKTLRTEQDRLWELLAIADTTESIIALEKRLTEVTTEIESSESRLRYMDNSIFYSTINLTIREVDTESPTQPETAFQQIKRGFTQNLNSLLSALSAAAIGLAVNSPTLLFILLLVILIWFIARKLKKRSLRQYEVPFTKKTGGYGSKENLAHTSSWDNPEDSHRTETGEDPKDTEP